jgi:hypothetical integral membrane protein (TIGR02206 family)
MEHLSAEHVAALAATAVAAALLVVGARRRGAPARDRATDPAAGGSGGRFAFVAARVLAFAMLAGFAVEQLTYALRGEWSAEVNLPFQLTDAVTLVAAVALWRPRPGLAAELVYFWALSASLQAVVTPDLDDTFPDVLYFTYFATHSGAIAAACLLVLGMGLTPRPGAVPRVYAVTAAFAVVAGVATVVTGGNYMFLRRKPVDGSLLDVMGPWPWYIAAGAALALVLFLALDALARRAAPARGPR